MANPIDLTTLAAVKLYLGGNIPNTLDPLLESLITAASAWVATYCNRTFQVEVYTETYDGTGTARLMLRQAPVISVASVTVDRVVWGASGSSGAPGYEFDENCLYAVNGHRFPFIYRTVRIEYTAGYATIPYDLQMAVNEMVALKFKQRDQIGVSARSIAGETISYTMADVPKSAKPVLNIYRRAAPL